MQQSKVWVAYAGVNEQYLLEVEFVSGMTIADAIEKSQIENLAKLPEDYAVGIFGVKAKDKAQVLMQGDRVEIYRALTINPKDIRRNRAAANPVGVYCRGNRFKQLK